MLYKGGEVNYSQVPTVAIRSHFSGSIIMNEAMSVCRFLKVEGSYIPVSTVSGAIFLVSIITNEATSAYRFLKVEVFFMLVFTAVNVINECNRNRTVMLSALLSVKLNLSERRSPFTNTVILIILTRHCATTI